MTIAAQNAQVVRAFFQTWGESYDAMINGFHAFVAEDCLLVQTRTPDLRGLVEIIPFLEHVRAAGLMETMEVELHNLISTETAVVAERMDVLYRPDGTVGARFPCVSVMEVANGKITGWRDYFDSADMPAGGVEIVNDSNNL